MTVTRKNATSIIGIVEESVVLYCRISRKFQLNVITRRYKPPIKMRRGKTRYVPNCLYMNNDQVFVDHS